MKSELPDINGISGTCSKVSSGRFKIPISSGSFMVFISVKVDTDPLIKTFESIITGGSTFTVSGSYGDEINNAYYLKVAQ